MAAEQTLPSSVWPSKALPAPKTRDVLAQLTDFLQKLGYDKTVKALLKESRSNGVNVDLTAWPGSLTESDPAGFKLGDLYVDFLLQEESDDEAEDNKEDADDAAADSVASSDTSSDSESDTDSESEDEVSDKPAVPKSTDLKRKRARSVSSDSDDSSSDSDTSEDEEPASKKSKQVANGANDTSDSDDGSSNEDSEEEDSQEDDDTSDSDTDSDTDSDVSGPPAASYNSNEIRIAYKTPSALANAMKERGRMKSVSATSSDTIAASPQPNGGPTDTSSTHPARQRQMDQQAAQTNGKAAKIEKKKSNVPFSRIPKDTAVDPRFSSNEYVPYDYANRAYQDLVVTKGKGFTKEKNKKKRGSYRGGVIDTTPKGIKFDD